MRPLLLAATLTLVTVSSASAQCPAYGLVACPGCTSVADPVAAGEVLVAFRTPTADGKVDMMLDETLVGGPATCAASRGDALDAQWRVSPG